MATKKRRTMSEIEAERRRDSRDPRLNSHEARLADAVATRLFAMDTARRAHLDKMYVLVDRDLAVKVNKVLEARDSSVEKYLEAQLIKFTKTRIIHSLSDILTFGQYEGLNVKEICQTDLDYMHWLVIQQKSPKFGSDVRQFVEQLARDDGRFEIPF